MGGMDDLDSEFIELNSSRERREYSNPTNFVKNNNNSQPHNFENSISFAYVFPRSHFPPSLSALGIQFSKFNLEHRLQEIDC